MKPRFLLSEPEALARFEAAVERCASLGLFATTFDPHAYAQADAERQAAQVAWERARQEARGLMAVAS